LSQSLLACPENATWRLSRLVTPPPQGWVAAHSPRLTKRTERGLRHDRRT
jgi:hypothetical protein